MLRQRSVTLLLLANIALTGRLFSEGSIQILAHRGASGHAPETTLASYRLALTMKVDFLELDVQMSSDGQLVAIHDTLLDRTTDAKGAVGEMTLQELKALDAGSWFNRSFPEKARPEFAGEKIPTLQEIIDLARDSSARLYIETKNPELYPPEFEAKLIELIRRNGFSNRVVIQSFNARSIEKVKELDPSFLTALLVSDKEIDPVEATARSGAGELAINFKLLTSEVVRRAREKGLAVTVWTVNEEQDLKRMIELGVNRIITDYPDRLARILAR